MKIRIVGDSDIVALGRAYQSNESLREKFRNESDVEFSKFFPFPNALKSFWERDGDEIVVRKSERGVRLTDDQDLSRIRPEADVVYVVSMPYRATVNTNSVWRRFSPWSFPVKGRPLVSDALIERAVKHNASNILGFIGELRQMCNQVIVVESPPIRDDSGTDETQRSGLTRSLYLNALGRAVLDREIADMGLDVVTCPEDSYQGAPRESYIRTEFHSESKSDKYHANVRYGEKQMEKLAAYLRSAGII